MPGERWRPPSQCQKRGAAAASSPKDSASLAFTSSRLEWVAGVLVAVFICGHLLLFSWWFERRDPVENTHGVTFNLSHPGAGRDDIDTQVHWPSELPAANICSGRLPKVPPGGCPEEVVTETLLKMFRKADRFREGDAAEASILDKAAEDAGGPPGSCAESTYSEITAAGLRSVLLELASLPRTMEMQPNDGATFHGYPFDIFIDLGAGTGQAAAAASLLGFAPRAVGVELGPQRFSRGCEALAEYNHSVSAGTRAAAQVCSSRLGQKAIFQPTLKLVRGDAREWPQLIAATGWPPCGPDSIVYLGAECFRDSLALAIGRTILLSCANSTRVAMLGRRFPAELLMQNSQNSTWPRSSPNRTRWFLELRSLSAATTSSARQDVFLYRIAEGGRPAMKAFV